MIGRKIKVLIVDDSAVMRQLLTELISSDPQIEVVGTASDPFIAREKIKALHPDVLTLDVEMPRMDGLTFLEKLMVGHPMPVLMVSSLTQQGCDVTMRALELGAVDFFPKPTIDLQAGIEREAALIIEKVKAAAGSRVVSRPGIRTDAPKSQRTSAGYRGTHQILLIGASTGGTEAIKETLTSMPSDAPGIVIVQHMPPGFTASFASRLNGLCDIRVKEAADGDCVLPGHALIAPGNFQTSLYRSGAEYYVKVGMGEPVNRHRPSVDVLFDSAAECAGANVVAALLTGMGDDGARGLRRLRDAGAHTIAQDEASCIVFGMPREAIVRGGAEYVLPLGDIAEEMLQLASGHSVQKAS